MDDDEADDVRLALFADPVDRGRADAILGTNLTKLCPLLDLTEEITYPQASAGASLPILPVELWIHILTGLADVKSLLTFRRVNKTARNFVNSLTEYRDVVDTFPKLVRVAVYTGVAS